MRYTTIFFDLDDTLYPRESGLWLAVRRRIELYMHERVGIPKHQISALRHHYLSTYGSSLRGLMRHYQVDPDDYLLYVHDVAVEEMIRPNGRLAKMLGQLPQRKWIFTNASLAHARRVLAALGISAHFDGILDVKAMGFASKPEAASYDFAFTKAGVEQPTTAVFVDDHSLNLEPAKVRGAATILVGTREPHPAADRSIPAVDDLLKALPALVE